MLKFAVSISWRVAEMMKEKNQLEHLSVAHLEALERAQNRWREFLLGRAPHPGEFEQHLLPVEELSGFTGKSPRANINRYFLRTSEMDTVTTSPTEGFVYTKIPRFILVGFFSMMKPREWVGTKLHVKEGIVSPRKYELPPGFGQYLEERLDRLESVKRGISSAQWLRIRSSMMKDPDRAATSDAFRALHLDVEMFGKNQVFPAEDD
ncbi:MAG: hypothetical protein U0P81_07960 [Holophagaceae bacterium]